MEDIVFLNIRYSDGFHCIPVIEYCIAGDFS